MSNETKKRTLYRSKSKAKLAGVCAGVAEYLGVEIWIVRVAFITGLVFSTGFFAVVYAAGWLILDKKPGDTGNNGGLHSPVELKTKVYQAGEPPKRAFQDISQELTELETKLRRMEKYVTSNEFQLNRELNRL
ncbi:MAG: envelope stress response membrane protein PspC [Idiomarina sp.]